MSDIRQANDARAEKDCFFWQEKRRLEPGQGPLLGWGFVYDTPLKNFPPF